MPDAPPTFAQFSPGDPFPRFNQLCQGTAFNPDTMAGRFLVFGFFGSLKDPVGLQAIETIRAFRDRFDDTRFSCFAVASDPDDRDQEKLKDALPGVRTMWDFDGKVGRLLGALPSDPGHDGPVTRRQFWLIVDPSLHVLATLPMAEAGGPGALIEILDRLPHPSRFAGFEIPAPVLVLPNVLDPATCRRLIGLYDQSGGNESGVMRNNVGVYDRSFKSRKDYTIEDDQVIRHLQGLISRRVLPEIQKLFFMKITRMERYMVGCYAADDGGHFRPHRDNTSDITGHRRFAISINLNADFDGGEVSFPEYNPRGIKAPPGWAVVFPCAALHMVSKVTRGRRYAFLPFVYDEGGAAIRQAYLNATAAAEAATAAVV